MRRRRARGVLPLGAALTRPRAELDKLATATPEGTAAQHAAKLAGMRKRVGALSGTLHSIQERLNRLHAALARLPATTLAELSRQELHAPPPPSPDALAARAGPLAAGPAQLLAAVAASTAPGVSRPSASAPHAQPSERGAGVAPQV